MAKAIDAAKPARAERIDAAASCREALEKRLEDGYLRIDEASLAGKDIAEWETFWIRLLREYEGICRELDQAA